MVEISAGIHGRVRHVLIAAACVREERGVCVYYIWIAPALLAELVVEGSLATWLYRPILRGPQANWLAVAFELTGGPALVMAVCFLLTGVGFQLYAPNAETIVDVWQEATWNGQQVARN